MERHPIFGVTVPERGWVPAPQYLLRRARVLEHLRRLPRGRVLEVGCGAGALLDDLSRLGFECVAVETSPAALELARWIHDGNERIRLVEEPDPAWHESFDVVLAFEVMEHIEHDREALATWASWLRPGGSLLLSVPAHPDWWNPSDVWAGHYRRYSREGLDALLREAGLVPEHIESYGVPLHNVVHPVRARMHARLMERERRGEDVGTQKAKNTARSGVERHGELKIWPLIASWPGARMFQLFAWMQTWFLRTDLGTGYLAVARRP
jgi:SAM-dependent methyltransferase